MKIPFFQSFQTGRSFRKGDPHAAAWKYLKRVGTLDNLQRVSSATSTPTTVANIACLRIRQAIELYDASLNTSNLTRPLLLYYCALNLVRGALLARHGETSSASHGMTYIAGSDLLDSKAKMSKNGTFPRLIESIWGGHTENTNSQSLTLLEILAQIPELHHEFHLIGITEPPIAEVHVEAFSNTETNLKYFIPSIDPKEFSENWQTFLPWMSDKCRYSSDMTLTLLDNLNDAEKKSRIFVTSIFGEIFNGVKMQFGMIKSLDLTQSFCHAWHLIWQVCLTYQMFPVTNLRVSCQQSSLQTWHL